MASASNDGQADGPAPLQPGARVGNYQVVALLGEGGSSTVYRAIHVHVRREVALKVLGPDFPPERFLAEARAIGSISQHPNIVEVYDCGETDDGQPYYVMELLQGSDLEHVLGDRTLTAAEVLPYLEQVCAGLEAAHRAGVVHRDVKQGNIFVLEGAPLRLKLFDFGIARLPELLTADLATTGRGQIFGTPTAMSPEQAAGEPDRIGPHSDIYSLGVMIYQMLAGRPPFVDDDLAQLLRRHIRDSPPPLTVTAPSVPRSVADVVHRCLAKRPEERYASAQELYEAYSSAVSAELEEAEEEEAAAAPALELPAVEIARDEPSLSLGTLPVEPSGPFEMEGTGLPTGKLQQVQRETRSPRGGRHGLAIAAGLVALLLAGLWFALRDGKETTGAAPPTAEAGLATPSPADAAVTPDTSADAAAADAAVAPVDADPRRVGADLAPTEQRASKKPPRSKPKKRKKKRPRRPPTPPTPPPAVRLDAGTPAPTPVAPVGEILDVEPKP